MTVYEYACMRVDLRRCTYIHILSTSGQSAVLQHIKAGSSLYLNGHMSSYPSFQKSGALAASLVVVVVVAAVVVAVRVISEPSQSRESWGGGNGRKTMLIVCPRFATKTSRPTLEKQYKERTRYIPGTYITAHIIHHPRVKYVRDVLVLFVFQLLRYLSDAMMVVLV